MMGFYDNDGFYDIFCIMLLPGAWFRVLGSRFLVSGA